MLSLPEFLQLMTSAQEAIVEGHGPPAWMNETQMFWLPQQQQVGQGLSDLMLLGAGNQEPCFTVQPLALLAKAHISC